MSRFEILRDELRRLRREQFVAIVPPAIAVALLLWMVAGPGTGLRAALLVLPVLPFLLHVLWRLISPAYRARADRALTVRTEIRALRQRIAGLFGKYRARNRGEQFKRVYGLAGRPVRDLEEALSVGMFREQREVFVTAFMRDGIAVRVTASIGTPFRCSAADDPSRWQDHVVRLGCDEIRQYHNHPEHRGSTAPSMTDIRSSRTIRKLLGPHGAKLRSLIICWNDLREWKVFEYDGSGRHSLHYEFDAAQSAATVPLHR